MSNSGTISSCSDVILYSCLITSSIWLLLFLIWTIILSKCFFNNEIATSSQRPRYYICCGLLPLPNTCNDSTLCLRLCCVSKKIGSKNKFLSIRSIHGAAWLASHTPATPDSRSKSTDFAVSIDRERDRDNDSGERSNTNDQTNRNTLRNSGKINKHDLSMANNIRNPQFMDDQSGDSSERSQQSHDHNNSSHDHDHDQSQLQTNDDRLGIENNYKSKLQLHHHHQHHHNRDDSSPLTQPTHTRLDSSKIEASMMEAYVDEFGKVIIRDVNDITNLKKLFATVKLAGGSPITQSQRPGGDTSEQSQTQTQSQLTQSQIGLTQTQSQTDGEPLSPPSTTTLTAMKPGLNGITSITSFTGITGINSAGKSSPGTNETAITNKNGGNNNTNNTNDNNCVPETSQTAAQMLNLRPSLPPQTSITMFSGMSNLHPQLPHGGTLSVDAFNHSLHSIVSSADHGNPMQERLFRQFLFGSTIVSGQTQSYNIEDASGIGGMSNTNIGEVLSSDGDGTIGGGAGGGAREIDMNDFMRGMNSLDRIPDPSMADTVLNNGDEEDDEFASDLPILLLNTGVDGNYSNTISKTGTQTGTNGTFMTMMSIPSEMAANYGAEMSSTITNMTLPTARISQISNRSVLSAISGVGGISGFGGITGMANTGLIPKNSLNMNNFRINNNNNNNNNNYNNGNNYFGARPRTESGQSIQSNQSTKKDIQSMFDGNNNKFEYLGYDPSPDVQSNLNNLNNLNNNNDNNNNNNIKKESPISVTDTSPMSAETNLDEMDKMDRMTGHVSTPIVGGMSGSPNFNLSTMPELAIPNTTITTNLISDETNLTDITELASIAEADSMHIQDSRSQQSQPLQQSQTQTETQIANLNQTQPPNGVPSKSFVTTNMNTSATGADKVAQENNGDGKDTPPLVRSKSSNAAISIEVNDEFSKKIKEIRNTNNINDINDKTNNKRTGKKRSESNVTKLRSNPNTFDGNLLTIPQNGTRTASRQSAPTINPIIIQQNQKILAERYHALKLLQLNNVESNKSISAVSASNSSHPPNNNILNANQLQAFQQLHLMHQMNNNNSNNVNGYNNMMAIANNRGILQPPIPAHAKSKKSLVLAIRASNLTKSRSSPVAAEDSNNKLKDGNKNTNTNENQTSNDVSPKRNKLKRVTTKLKRKKKKKDKKEKENENISMENGDVTIVMTDDPMQSGATANNGGNLSDPELESSDADFFNTNLFLASNGSMMSDGTNTTRITHDDVDNLPDDATSLQGGISTNSVNSIRDWTYHDVCDWLKSELLNKSELTNDTIDRIILKFEMNYIAGHVLLVLDQELLESIGIETENIRKKILQITQSKLDHN